MNTPAHAIINLALAHKIPNRPFYYIIIGAFIPDLALFLYYAVSIIFLSLKGNQIWQSYSGYWQFVVEILHSIPLQIILILITFKLSKKMALLFASMLMHSFFDLLTHNIDAHHHFLPLSDYVFRSPVSYWDFKHFGITFLIFEATVTFSYGYYLYINSKIKNHRTALNVLLALYFVSIALTIFIWN